MTKITRRALMWLIVTGCVLAVLTVVAAVALQQRVDTWVRIEAPVDGVRAAAARGLSSLSLSDSGVSTLRVQRFERIELRAAGQQHVFYPGTDGSGTVRVRGVNETAPADSEVARLRMLGLPPSGSFEAHITHQREKPRMLLRIGSGASPEDETSIMARLIPPFVVDIHNARTHVDSATFRSRSFTVRAEDPQCFLKAEGRGAGLSARFDLWEPEDFSIAGTEITTISLSRLSDGGSAIQSTMQADARLSYDAQTGADDAEAPWGAILEAVATETCQLGPLRLSRADGESWTMGLDVRGEVRECTAGDRDLRQTRYVVLIPAGVRVAVDQGLIAMLLAGIAAVWSLAHFLSRRSESQRAPVRRAGKFGRRLSRGG